LCNDLFDPDFVCKINNHPYYIAAGNGMVNLKTGCLEGFDPKFHLTEACKNNFISCSCPLGSCTMDKDCDSKCDLSFMHKTWLQVMAYDKELYNHFRWSVGYAMVGDPKKKKLLMGSGPQFNAKSLFSSCINDVFSIYCKVMSTSVIVQTNKGAENGHSAQLTHLNGSRLGNYYLCTDSCLAVLKSSKLRPFAVIQSTTEQPTRLFL
jgi:phage/plasmid-associated DNA primase